MPHQKSSSYQRSSLCALQCSSLNAKMSENATNGAPAETAMPFQLQGESSACPNRREKSRGRKRRLMPFLITKLQKPTRARSAGCELLGAIRSACPVQRRSTECERLTNLHERCWHFHITKKCNSFKEIALEKAALQNPGPRTSRMSAAARL